MSYIKAGGNVVCGPSLIANTTAGEPSTPANAYVAEDGTTFYVAEDGTTFYVQET